MKRVTIYLVLAALSVCGLQASTALAKDQKYGGHAQTRTPSPQLYAQKKKTTPITTTQPNTTTLAHKDNSKCPPKQPPFHCGTGQPGTIVDPVHPSGPAQPVISDPITIVGNGAGTTKGFHPPLGTIKPITNTAVMTGGTTTNGSPPSRPDYIWDGDHWVRSTSGQIYTPIPVRDHRGEGNPDRGGGVTVTPVPGKQRTNDVVGVGGSPIDEVINYFATGWRFPHGKLDTAGTTRDHRGQ